MTEQDLNTFPDEDAPMPEPITMVETVTLSGVWRGDPQDNDGWAFKISAVNEEGKERKGWINWYPKHVVEEDEKKRLANKISWSSFWVPLFKLAGYENKESYPKYNPRALATFLNEITAPDHEPMTFNAQMRENNAGFMNLNRIMVK